MTGRVRRAAGGLLVAAGWLLSACLANPAIPPPVARMTWTPPPSPAPNIVVAAVRATSTLTPVVRPTQVRADGGLQATLTDYEASVGPDPSGSKYNAFQTLTDFVDPIGRYAGTWWLRDDGVGDIYEALAVILYTEGHTNWDVRTAVAARYLWFCGGAGTVCQGRELINFLSYFQPWREPWMSRGFTSDNAAQYEDFARELVNQQSGLLTTIIPGADTYVHSEDALSSVSSIDWFQTPFHFANVDPTWDAYLRRQLRRSPNGGARLWVLTMSEAGRVCGSQFICEDMTQPRN
jgi:hypothetical protein